MGRRIIKKKNGLFAVWTTVCDNFLLDDVTQEELIETLSEWAKEDERKRLEDQINNNRFIYNNYEERCELRDELHAEIPDTKDIFEE